MVRGCGKCRYRANSIAKFAHSAHFATCLGFQILITVQGTVFARCRLCLPSSNGRVTVLARCARHTLRLAFHWLVLPNWAWLACLTFTVSVDCSGCTAAHFICRHIKRCINATVLGVECSCYHASARNNGGRWSKYIRYVEYHPSALWHGNVDHGEPQLTCVGRP